MTHDGPYDELDKVAGPAVVLRLAVYDDGPVVTIEWADPPDPAHLSATATTLLEAYRSDGKAPGLDVERTEGDKT